MKLYKTSRLRWTAALAISIMLLTTVWIPSVWAIDDDTLIDWGDSLQLLLPIAGFTGTFIADDPEGRIQFLQTFGTSLAVMGAGKVVFDKMRPQFEEGNCTSFPSGHTTSPFSGAAFIYERYGKLWGIPAYALAALTGYSRIVADKHYWDDVIAGASVGIMSSWYWVSPFKTDVMVLPIATDDGMGMSLVVQDSAFEKDKEIKLGKRRPKYSYTIAFAPMWQQENFITAPTATGTTFNLADFDEVGEPISTALAVVDWYIGKRHTLTFGIVPYEQRDTGSFTQNTNFNGVLFPAGTPVVSAWRHYQGWVNYAYNFFPDSEWIFELGAGLTYQYTSLEIASQDETLFSEVEDSVILPLAHLHFGYRITDRWSVETAANGIYLSSDQYFDAQVETGYMLSKRWRLALGVEHLRPGYRNRQADGKIQI